MKVFLSVVALVHYRVISANTFFMQASLAQISHKGIKEGD
jgi:hypothetical protein